MNKRNKRHATLIAMCALALGLLAGYGIKVFAEGSPTQQPLFYTGSLEDNGAAANGDYTVKLTLHDAANGGSELCAKSALVPVRSGRFRLDVSECADKLQTNPDVWVAVSITGSDGMERAIGARSKIGSVPYALEAQHAVGASNATGKLAADVQALTKRVGDLENAVATKSGFQAIKHSAQTLSNGTNLINFESEEFDFDNEFDTTTSTFTAKSGGYYEFSCMVSWQLAQGVVVAQFEAAIVLNGGERAFTGFTSDGYATTRQVQAVIKLAAGDKVQCSALQETGPQPLNVNNVSFEGRRFAQ